jgi:hypothetical protein
LPDALVGGLNSGRRGRPLTIEDCLVIDLPLLMRLGWVRQGQMRSGVLRWIDNGEPVGSITYQSDLANLTDPALWLIFNLCLDGGGTRQVEQRVRLTLTRPNYGGLRWWLSCPITDRRATKLYKPPGQDLFASRHVWGLGYRSQRAPSHLEAVERLQKIHSKLGACEHWEVPLLRPKGMWRRTFHRYLARSRPLGRLCQAQMDELDQVAGTKLH